jgi:hypothetical protein
MRAGPADHRATWLGRYWTVDERQPTYTGVRGRYSRPDDRGPVSITEMALS